MIPTHTIEFRRYPHGPQPAAARVIHGVALGPTGGCIASARHFDGHAHLIGFRTYPPSLAAMAADLEALTEGVVYLDSGLHGPDLYDYLGGRRRRGLRLWESPKPELRRAELAGKLRSAREAKAFTMRAALRLNVSLRKALGDATREDAGERPEIVALSLAVIDRRRVPRIW